MRRIQFALISLFLSANLSAQDIQIVGTIDQTLKNPSSTNFAQTKEAKVNEKIKLLKIQLSENAKKNLAERAKNALSHKGQFALNTLGSKFPAKVELSMNNVPVLNQGMHGTCATFANTAAIDAVLKKGDYVSQLCLLQLGNYLEKNAFVMSGWDGAWGRTVLSQLEVHGIISKEQQQNHGCGELTEYPLNDTDDTHTPMPLEEYHQLSETISEQVPWSPLLDVYEAILNRVDTNKTLNEVKGALNAGDRLTMGVLLLDLDMGLVGAVGKNKVNYDTWVLTPEIARDVFLNPNYAAHEMVITGYDDNAVAIDEDGREYRGLLTLRNSWGDKVGDHGDFYMTYDFFKLLVLEVQRIRNLTEE